MPSHTFGAGRPLLQEKPHPLQERFPDRESFRLMRSEPGGPSYRRIAYAAGAVSRPRIVPPHTFGAGRPLLQEKPHSLQERFPDREWFHRILSGPGDPSYRGIAYAAGAASRPRMVPPHTFGAGRPLLQGNRIRCRSGLQTANGSASCVRGREAPPTGESHTLQERSPNRESFRLMRSGPGDPSYRRIAYVVGAVSRPRIVPPHAFGAERSLLQGNRIRCRSGLQTANRSAPCVRGRETPPAGESHPSQERSPYAVSRSMSDFPLPAMLI